MTYMTLFKCYAKMTQIIAKLKKKDLCMTPLHLQYDHLGISTFKYFIFISFTLKKTHKTTTTSTTLFYIGNIAID